MYYYTVAKVDISSSHVPAPEAVEYIEPVNLQYVDKVSTDRIVKDYLKYTNYPDDTTVIILEQNPNAPKTLSDDIIIRTLGKRFNQEKLGKLSRIFGNEIFYSTPLDDVVIKKIVPDDSEVSFSRREMKVTIPVTN